jgi:hypothetical protein
MKPLNRNRAFVALAIIVIPLLIIIGMGKMSVLTSILSMFTVLFLTIVAGIYILYRFPADGAKRNVGFDPYSVPVERTRVSIIIEVITGIFTVASWIIAIATRHFIGEDGGILYHEIANMIIFTLIILSLVIDMHRPCDFFLTGKLTNAKQVGIASLMYGVLALLCAVFLLTYAVPALYVNSVAICWFAVVICTIIGFRIRIHKA